MYMPLPVYMCIMELQWSSLLPEGLTATVVHPCVRKSRTTDTTRRSTVLVHVLSMVPDYGSNFNETALRSLSATASSDILDTSTVTWSG